MIKGKFFKCDCSSEGLWVCHSNFGTEMSIFVRSPLDRSWKNRFRLAWACIKGKPYGDELIMGSDTLADLVDHLVEIQNYKF